MNQSGNTTLWKIEARGFLISYTPFAHNFWVLADECNQAIDQIHGLAVDPFTGVTKAIGNSRHWLQAVRDSSITWSLQPNQPIAIAAEEKKETIQKRWQAALYAIPAINGLCLPYPNLWQHGTRPNSNSIFNTIGQILGFSDPPSLLSTWAPGVEVTIGPEIIAHYCYKIRPEHTP